MTRREAWPVAALGLLLVLALAQWPGQFSRWRALVWPVVKLWPDTAAQYGQQWGASQFAALQRLSLGRTATVLLVTPGTQWRQDEYWLYHRALYWLAPRRVIWAAPVTPDGSWESRWHRPTELTPAALAARAAEVGADCLVAWNVPATALPGEVVAVNQDSVVMALGEAAVCAGPPLSPVRADPMWVEAAKAVLAMAVLALLGVGALPLLARLGFHPTGAEALALGWLIGAAAATTLLLWLSALGLPWETAVRVVAVVAVPVGVWGGWRWWRGRRGSRMMRLSEKVTGPRRVVNGLLLTIIGVQVLAVAVTALGQPLEVWDSWINWGMKARLIYLANGFTPALWADPTRLVTLPDYPLFVPLLQAWTYTWLGQFADRWAGLPLVLAYVALLVGLPASLQRQGVVRTVALLATAAAACLPALASLVSAAFPDAVMAALATLAATYLLEWTRRGPIGAALVAAVLAGLLPWTKREGVLLALVFLGAAALLVWHARRRDWRRLTVLGALPFAIFAGPWYAFTALGPVPNLAYLPVTLPTYAANATRLLYVGWRGLRAATEVRLSWVWPITLAGLALMMLTARDRWRGLDAAALIGFGVPLVYLLVLAQSYAFSTFVPFEVHVVTSLERLVVHVSLLPIIWLALRSAPATGEAIA